MPSGFRNSSRIKLIVSTLRIYILGILRNINRQKKRWFRFPKIKKEYIAVMA